MHYNEDKQCWVLGYLYLIPMVTVKGTNWDKRMLGKKRSWVDVYKSQIHDMVEGGVASKVPEFELATYNGPISYLLHLAVQNPGLKSTPVRICLEASSAQGSGLSLNQILAKGQTGS